MSIEEIPARTLTRETNWFTRASLYAVVPGALLAAGWITAGRVIFGAGGDLVPIFALTFGPGLLAVLLFAGRWMLQHTQRHEPGTGTTMAIALLQVTTWLLALIFGLLCPDRVDGRTVSAASQILGDDFIGLSAGFGNTFGILTFVSAFAMFFVAMGQARRSAKLAAGITEDDEERLARENSEYDFLD